MSEWKLDARTSGDILQKIGEIAADYTPEWNFDPEHPDIGYALAQVYADMLEGTLKQWNRAGYKHQLALFNCLGARLHEAAPAGGHAVFQISSAAPEGTEVPAYAGMTAELPGGDGMSRFETQADLYVTPAVPVCFYLTDGAKDRICCLAEKLPQELEKPLVLFAEKGENLQSHELYLTHRELFRIRGEACLELHFYIREGKLLDERILEQMADPQAVRITYFSEDGWQEFDRTAALSGSLQLWKGRNQPPFAGSGPEGAETYAVRFQNLDIRRLGPVPVEEIRILGRGERLKPEYVYGASSECGEGAYFPFGERPHLYEEVYFGSGEALGKRGARVSLRFQMDFVKVPLESGVEKSPIEWKWIMKRSEFRPDPEYDVTIEEVIWEYFNGSGWSRLFPGKEYGDVFSAGRFIKCRHRGILDSGESADNLLHFRQLDPKSPYLHLAVAPADKLDVPIRQETNDVSGVIHPFVAFLGAVRILRIDFRRLLGPVQISPGHLVSRNAQFSRNSYRNPSSHAVQDIQLDVGDGFPDGELLFILLDPIIGHIDRTLGRAVDVVVAGRAFRLKGRQRLPAHRQML